MARLKWGSPIKSEAEETTTWKADNGLVIIRPDWNKRRWYVLIEGNKSLTQCRTLAEAKHLAEKHCKEQQTRKEIHCDETK